MLEDLLTPTSIDIVVDESTDDESHVNLVEASYLNVKQWVAGSTDRFVQQVDSLQL